MDIHKNVTFFYEAEYIGKCRLKETTAGIEMIKNSENADSGIRESLVAGLAFFSILEMKFDGRFVILEKCSAETSSHTQLLLEGAEIC